MTLWSKTVERAKKIGVVAGAAIAVITLGTLLQKWLIVDPMQHVATASVNGAVEAMQAEFWKLRQTVVAQGAISAVTDSIMFLRMGQVEATLGERYYNRSEIDAMVRRMSMRQDSMVQAFKAKRR